MLGATDVGDTANRQALRAFMPPTSPKNELHLRNLQWLLKDMIEKDAVYFVPQELHI